MRQTGWQRLHQVTALAGAGVFFFSCASPPATTLTRTVPKASAAKAKFSEPASTSQDPSVEIVETVIRTPETNPPVPESKSPADSTPVSDYFGRVLGVDGKPAPGAVVTAHLLQGKTSSLLSNFGAGLVNNHGGNILSNHGGYYRLMAAETLAATTDSNGLFSLSLPPGVAANVEAQLGDEIKAIRGGVTAGSSRFDLQLAPTGVIQGVVSVPADSKVTNLLGVSVFIPGTSYAARTDVSGNFQINNVASGTFALWAEKSGVGEALSAPIQVSPRASSKVGSFVLRMPTTSVTSVVPSFAMEGSKVVIKGERFGLSRGATFKIRLNGVEVESVSVKSDTEAEFNVPEGARGPLVVAVDEVKSEQIPFTVVKKWEVRAPAGPLTAGSQASLSVNAYDHRDQVLRTHQVKPTWQSSSVTVAEVNASGTIQALSPGLATITGTYQGWKAEIPIQVVNVGDESGGALGGLVVELPDTTKAALGASGTLYLSAGTRVFSLSPSGQLTALAGSESDQVKDGVGLGANFEAAGGIAYDASGTRLVVGDYNRIRNIALPSLQVTTLAGPNRYLEDSVEDKDGLGPAAGINDPAALAVASDGSIWFMNSDILRNLQPSGMVTTVEGAPPITALSKGSDQVIYALSSVGQIFKIQSDNPTSPLQSHQIGLVWEVAPMRVQTGAMAHDGLGNFFFATDSQILKLDAGTNRVKVLSGTDSSEQRDGSLNEARFLNLVSIIFDDAANRLILVEESAIRALDLTSDMVSTIVHRGQGTTDITANAPTEIGITQYRRLKGRR